MKIETGGARLSRESNDAVTCGVSTGVNGFSAADSTGKYTGLDVDICRAIGRAVELAANHDGRLVADVVADWARRHGEPFTLTLDGPGGNHFSAGSGGPALELDAVEFCRILSGRAPGSGLLATSVPF